MARTVLALLVVASLLAGACSSDDDGDAESSPTATTTRGAVTPGPNATSPSASPDAGNQEVVGIVGAVNQADGRIEINRLSGADVQAVLVTSATRILSGQGRPLTLADLRPSDRLIASGTVDGAEMTADRVEIQAVLPGASPGG